MTTEPQASALAPSSWPLDGIAPASPQPVTRVVGLSQAGELYLYGPTASAPGETIPSVTGIVIDLRVSRRGAGSRYGERDYLDLRLATLSPDLHLLLRIPCHQGQWSYRTLLGALERIDMSATAIKIEAVKGREATFLQVSLDPEGRQRVKAQALEPDRTTLELTVNHLRSGLGLPPQFL